MQWSSDSSLLKLTITAPGFKPYVWGYDLKNDEKVTDPNEIQPLWLERNQI